MDRKEKGDEWMVDTADKGVKSTLEGMTGLGSR